MADKVKIGLFGIGLETCWSQFEGLPDKLKSYQLRIKLSELLNIGFKKIC